MLQIDFTPQEARNFERWFRENAKEGTSFEAVRRDALRVFEGRLYAGQGLMYELCSRYSGPQRPPEYVASLPALGITQETVIQALIEQAGEFDDDELLEGVTLRFGGDRVDTGGWLQEAVSAGQQIDVALHAGIRSRLQQGR